MISYILQMLVDFLHHHHSHLNILPQKYCINLTDSRRFN